MQDGLRRLRSPLFTILDDLPIHATTMARMLHGKTGVSWHASLFAARIYKQSGGIVDFFKQTMRFAPLTPMV
ncbi:hypothetical protein [Rivihabitans pingtungensis]|uniref:hypothetical protein n=1 Tax=Rivihabitans pingtungensis TaxID=1054498 RepID=UPI002357E2F8|nr:hypothetical protein [Rivihabitans pingtungensis]MCK6435657.1 hypothetical protein [Rivihabitans pingtungensis]